MYAALANPQQRYKQQGILTANPAELVVMLYDGCIKQLKIANLAIGEKNFNRSDMALRKAVAILMELVNSLSLEYSIARELLELYEFVINEIALILLEEEAGRIPGVLTIMEELRDAWRTVAKETQGTAELV
ncbi:MAG: flagellar export chaperone FliS [Clostridiales bacterium]|jgi:flagellar protein FliS|nr:flagellar export chaperone FliS [Clostridiales bacterium]